VENGVEIAQIFDFKIVDFGYSGVNDTAVQKIILRTPKNFCVNVIDIV
jgi:hypothetical protein